MKLKTKEISETQIWARFAKPCPKKMTNHLPQRLYDLWPLCIEEEMQGCIGEGNSSVKNSVA